MMQQALGALGYARIGPAMEESLDLRVNGKWTAALLEDRHPHGGGLLPPLRLAGAQQQSFDEWFDRYIPEVIVSVDRFALPFLQARRCRIPPDAGYTSRAHGNRGHLAGGTEHEAALNVGAEVEPVGKIDALQAIAICKIQSESDYKSTLVNLDQAAELKGVDWSRPTTAMLRGDALRMSGSFPGAITSYESILDMPDVAPGTKAVAWLKIGRTQQYVLSDAGKAKEAYAKAIELNPGLRPDVDGHTEKLP